MRTVAFAVGLLALLTAWVPVVAQGPVSTAFTYQGRMNEAGVPADGLYDFQFKLFDSLNGGAQIGDTQQIDDWPVADGIFTVQLDFGTSAFSGDVRFLEVAVRSGIDPYTTLSPRQELTAAPYALYALNGPGSGEGYWEPDGDNIVNTNSGRVGIGITGLPFGKLAVYTSTGIYGLHVENGSAGLSTGIYAIGKNAGGSFEATGTGQFDNGVTGYSLNGFGGYFTGRGYFSGNVGIGTASPSSPLHIQGTGNIMQEISSNHVAGTWFELENTSSGGHRWALVSTGSINGEGSGRLLLRNITDGFTAMTLNPNGNVGVGTTSPSAKLEVSGTTRTDVLEITGADVAERFPVSGAASDVKPGMVMEIDPDNPGKLRVAKGAYNRRVAGVVSGAGNISAGTILGNLPGSEDQPPIALTQVEQLGGANGPGDSARAVFVEKS